jgi:hypothetical protein
MPIPLPFAIAAAATTSLLATISTQLFVVPAGAVGVRRLFGVVKEVPVAPGLHFKHPFAAVLIESTRTRSIECDNIEVLTNEGLPVGFQVSRTSSPRCKATPQLPRTSLSRASWSEYAITPLDPGKGGRHHRPR